jgi:hypothetical protein
MRDLKPLFLVLGMMLLGSVCVTESQAAKRSFEECQALAVSRGVPVRFTSGKVDRKYQLYKSAGETTHPKGLIARCMTGSD